MLWNKLVASIRNIWRPVEATIIGIDIGTTKIAAVVARIDSDSPKILGMARVPFNGVVWTGSNKITITSNAINSAVKAASKSAGCSSQSAAIGISDIATGINSTGIIRITRRVSRCDIRRTLAVAANIVIPDDMAVLEQVINSFSLDELERIDDPVGMTGSCLEVLTHIVIGRQAVLEVVTTACKLAGFKIKKVSASELASAAILLSREERKQGVCLLDIGGEYTSMVVYESGTLRYTASVPWAGNHLTSCIGLRLGLDKDEAEKVKIAFSTYEATDTDEQDEAVRSLLDERLRELCTLLNNELHKSGLKENLKAGIVLSGGTSALPGLPGIVGNVFGLPVRRATFNNANWLDGVPLEYAGAVGLALHGSKTFGVPRFK